MRVKLRHLVSTVTIALGALAACHEAAPRRAVSRSASPRVVNLHAFARLYGVLRWFHPSDAGSAIDWDQFAVDGVRRVMDARDASSLHATLATLIAPIAPSVRLSDGNEHPPAAAIAPPSLRDNAELIAWEHEGFGDSTLTTVYASKRRHRSRIVAAHGATFAVLSQSVDATAFRGARVRLRAKLRTSTRGLGRIWMRIDRGDQAGFFDNMRDRPVSSPTWVMAEIVGSVDRDATRITFGTLMWGDGSVWYDDVALDVQGGDEIWRSIKIEDPGFESKDLLTSWSPGTGRATVTGTASLEGWRVVIDHSAAATGASSLRVEPETKLVTDELFADSPDPGETIDIDLGQGLWARIPLSLDSVNGHTVGDDPEAAQRLQRSSPMPRPANFDRDWGIADAIVAWNALEHFWPYWDTISIDWSAELDRALTSALEDRNLDDHARTLRRLSAAAPDGHAKTICPGETPEQKAPFVVDELEGQVVITATASPSLERGDVIVSIDGRPAREQLAADAALVSGSPQWKLLQARLQFGAGPGSVPLALVVRREHRELALVVPRRDEPVREFLHHSIERLADGTYYVDLAQADRSQVAAVMTEIAAAPSVVFDLREYPLSNREVISHLITKPVDTDQGMSIPHVIRPDHAANWSPTWKTFHTILPVLEPHIGGRVAFLIGPAAYSYSETLLRLVEYYHLGELVGSATAGVNGSTAELVEPTGCRTWFTGMRVTRIDGTRNHLIGIRPTIPVVRTIEGVRAGRDEVLERALAYVRERVQ